MCKILAALLFLSPSLAFGQGYQYRDQFVKQGVNGLVAFSGFASVCSASGLTTTSASVTSNVATLVMSSNPITAGFVTGRNVLIINFTGADVYFNGTFALTNVTTTTLQYAVTHFNAVATSNGGALQYPSSPSSGCAPAATVYSDAALTSPLVQPFGGDTNGNFLFFASPGSYWLGESGPSATPSLFFLTLPFVPGASGSLNLVSPTITGTDNGTETLQNKTIDVSANTIKNRTNTAGHYLRNNGTQYVDNTIQGADVPATTSNCSGVQFAQGLNAGMTPVCAAPPTFVASGASHAVGYVPDPGASAGATKFLREDATWVAPGGGVTEAVFGTSLSTLTNNTCSETSSVVTCVETTFANAHTITRFTFFVLTAPSGCSTNQVVGVRDMTSATNLESVTVNQASSQYVDSGALSISITSGHKIAVGTLTSPAGCSTAPVVNNLQMVYQ